MRKKTLPIETRPPIVGYTVYPLSILATRRDYLPWFHSRHIQLYCPRGFPEDRTAKFDFYRHPLSRLAPCPLLETLWLNRNSATDARGHIVPFVLDRLDEGHYVQLYANEFYIPDRRKYQRHHYTHALLVFGCDGQNAELDILGYNRQGIFAASKVGFAQLEQAFRRVHYLPDRMDRICLMRYARDKTCGFDLPLVREQLRDYVYARNTSERFRMLENPVEGTFGLDTYACLLDHCRRLLARPAFPDIRPLHILWEHKKCMRARIEYMETHRYLSPPGRFSRAYAEIEQEAGTFRMMMLKYGVTKDASLIDRIAVGLDRVREKERVLLEHALAEMAADG